MSSNRLFIVIGALIFAAVALASIYRLMVGIPITISGHAIGQTTSFFAFAISTALCLMLLKSAFSTR
jgi:hypothetical protein